MTFEKFTPQQLAKVATAHETGVLRRFGWERTDPTARCIIQAALGTDRSPFIPSEATHTENVMYAVMDWFDSSYKSTWSRFSRALRRLKSKR